MKTLCHSLFALLLISLCTIDAKKKAKEPEKADKVSKCLKLKDKKAQTDCLVAAFSSRPGEWSIGPVSKSPINDAPSVRAAMRSETGTSEMAIGCYEGQLYVNFDMSMYLSTMNRYFYPIIYRVDSEPAVDCTSESPEQKCYSWALSSGSTAAGIWGNPDEFVQEIKDAKKLTVRVSNVSGDQKTAIFSMKDVLPTFEKIKSLCVFNESAEKEKEGESSP